MNANGIPYESTVIVYDLSGKIVKAVKGERAYCKRGQAEIIDVPLEVTESGKTMVLLIKPLVNYTPSTTSEE